MVAIKPAICIYVVASVSFDLNTVVLVFLICFNNFSFFPCNIVKNTINPPIRRINTPKTPSDDHILSISIEEIIANAIANSSIAVPMEAINSAIALVLNDLPILYIASATFSLMYCTGAIQDFIAYTKVYISIIIGNNNDSKETIAINISIKPTFSLVKFFELVTASLKRLNMSVTASAILLIINAQALIKMDNNFNTMPPTFIIPANKFSKLIKNSFQDSKVNMIASPTLVN